MDFDGADRQSTPATVNRRSSSDWRSTANQPLGIPRHPDQHRHDSGISMGSNSAASHSSGRSRQSEHGGPDLKSRDQGFAIALPRSKGYEVVAEVTNESKKKSQDPGVVSPRSRPPDISRRSSEEDRPRSSRRSNEEEDQHHGEVSSGRDKPNERERRKDHKDTSSHSAVPGKQKTAVSKDSRSSHGSASHQSSRPVAESDRWPARPESHHSMPMAPAPQSQGPRRQDTDLTGGGGSKSSAARTSAPVSQTRYHFSDTTFRRVSFFLGDLPSQD